MRRQDAGRACLGAQFLHQFVTWAVRTRPRIPLVGNHVGADESLDLRGNGVGSISSWMRISGSIFVGAEPSSHHNFHCGALWNRRYDTELVGEWIGYGQ